MKRNPAVEMFRVVLTFGIVLLHAITKCGHHASAVTNYGAYFLYCCVVGFVFISGYYGMKMSAMKLAKLWGEFLFSLRNSVVGVGFLRICRLESILGHPYRELVP